MAKNATTTSRATCPTPRTLPVAMERAREYLLRAGGRDGANGRGGAGGRDGVVGGGDDAGRRGRTGGGRLAGGASPPGAGGSGSLSHQSGAGGGGWAEGWGAGLGSLARETGWPSLDVAATGAGAWHARHWPLPLPLTV